MRSKKFDHADELTKVLDRHLRAGQGEEDGGSEGMEGWAMMILAFRARGSENFSQSESRVQVSDLTKPLNQLLELLGNLGRADRRRIDVGLTAYLSVKKGAWTSLKVTTVEEMLRSLQQGLEWHQANAPIMARPRRLAHEAVDWRRISTAWACTLVWAKNAKRLQTAAWRKHTQDLPPHLAGPETSDLAVMEWLETFAPETINRTVPGPFGRFLQDVLNVLPDRNSKGEPYDASDTLRALRRVQDRKVARQ